MIKLICGSTRIGNTVFTPASGVFSADEEIEKRLVVANAAVFVRESSGEGAKSFKGMAGTAVPHSNIPVNEPSANNDSSEASDSSEDYEDEDSEDNIPSYSEESTNAELQAIASEWGIDLPNRANKAQILEILDSYFGNAPELSAEDPQI